MVDLSFLKAQPTSIVIGHGIDYFNLYKIIRLKYKTSYLLESLALHDVKKQERYLTIGFDPLYKFKAQKNQFIIFGTEKLIKKNNCNPYHELQSLMPKLKKTKTHQGGLIGYLNYEAINYFEPSLNLEEHEDFSNFELGLYYDGLIYDVKTKQLSYYTHYKDRSAEIKKLTKNLNQQIVPLPKSTNEGYDQTKEQYMKAVGTTINEIKKGNTFQAEVGIGAKYNIKGDKFAIYESLRNLNPSPYMYYLKFDHRELFGASPELVVSMDSGKVLSTPAAGTIRRGKTNDQDEELGKQLLNDPKEIAEHNMLVDLHRNDISKVCKPGSVKVENLKHIMKFNYVQHIVSDIVGDIDEDKDSFDLLASIMPCGVLTGAPKIETIKIIDRNEQTPRGPYGGAVGRFSFNGDCAFTMPIRSLFCSGEKCYTKACAGIVFDSIAEKEYDEVMAKLKAVEMAIGDSEI